jgi:MFS family permease
MAEQAPAYIYLAFVFAYGTQVIHQDRDFLLTSLICAGIVSLATIPLAGHSSDRIGRKRMYLIGSALTGLFGFAYSACSTLECRS